VIAASYRLIAVMARLPYLLRHSGAARRSTRAMHIRHAFDGHHPHCVKCLS